MTATEHDAATADGTRIVLRTWPAEGAQNGPATGALFLVHGLGEHARRYDHVARAVAALGVEVRSYDQRGFGRSGGARGTVPTPEALVDDAAELFARYAGERRAAGDAAPPFVLGHSMGGCVVARAVTAGRIAPRGMVLSSPALVPRMGAADRWATALGERLIPNVRVPHRLPMHRLSHDPAVEAAVRADADAHDRITARLAAFMRRAGAAAIDDARRCAVPTLLLVAGDDHFVDPDGARRFHANLPPGVGTLRVYDALWHEVFNERAEDRARVLDDLTAWLRGRLAA
ncbi:alpha/beta hydrolase [Roseisolibacter sp. H3M3-2]|uniref:alpha/beta hydrolase n=1 Tax=Roseisolibacter sp. H3M3-2 TaxID=3031323 RepID=UPI0023DAC156|nr:alpha/beta hydrolase [Roseisolibacter sp. H3M3-2]MDF1502760.1 lysophospholipase [Roseisolibacter sp. H3M3-2]